MRNSKTLLHLSALSLLSASSIIACGDSNTNGGNTEPPLILPPPEPPIAPITVTTSDRFTTHDACAQCHFAGTDTPVMHDTAGNDISPVYTWRSSMMAFAARDPYYLAIFGEELLKHPTQKDFLETTCTRCHAPAGSVEHEQSGGHLTYESLLHANTKEANLARDGITCSLCHQIQDNNLGDVESFTGGFTIGWERKIYGPHLVPKTDPMQLIVNYTPTSAAHTTTSELCATCHTVVTPILINGQHNGDFLEQAPYLEWKNSTFSPGAPCSTCHLPTKDPTTMADHSTPISKWPANLTPRSPFGKHRFSGGNAYMLSLLAENLEWTGSTIPKTELEEAANLAKQHLKEAPVLSILSSTIENNSLTVVIMVENHAGHKLPTGYPGRRAWLHLTATTATGEIIFESGKYNEEGSLIDRTGKPLDDPNTIMPHFNDINAENQVQVYEAIAGDTSGKPTHLPLSSIGYLKDNRLLPIGWSKKDTWIKWIAPVGTNSDISFAAGMDLITYHLPNPSQIKSLKVEMLYQTVRPTELNEIAKTPHPAAVAFSNMTTKHSPTPIPIAQAETNL